MWPSETGYAQTQAVFAAKVEGHLTDHALGLICNDCGCPIETAIEGEPICASCRAGREATREDYEVAQWVRFMQTHCEGCDAPLAGGGVCPSCKAERDATAKMLEFLDYGGPNV